MCSGCQKKRQAMLDQMQHNQPAPARFTPVPTPVTPSPHMQQVLKTIETETPEETEKRVIGQVPATVSFNKFNI